MLARLNKKISKEILDSYNGEKSEKRNASVNLEKFLSSPSEVESNTTQ